jgi:hypothetical protein
MVDELETMIDGNVPRGDGVAAVALKAWAE